MRRIQPLHVALVCWLLFFAATVAAQGGDPASRIPKLSQLASKAADQGTVRVIVELDVPDIEMYTAASSRIKAGLVGLAQQRRAKAADAALKTRIAGRAVDLMNAVAPAGARMLRRYDAFPLVALDVSADALEKLSRSSLVRHVVEDRLAKPLLDNTVNIIGASASWSSGYTGSGWSVAILDTGILPSHDFFAGKDIVEACFSASGHCPNDETSMTGAGAAAHHPSSYVGYDHGTHVAGIAAGKRIDGSLAGVAKDAGIIAVQVFSRFDNSDYCSPFDDCVLSWTSDQIAALDYLYSLRTTVNIAAVNLSLGGGAYDSICDDEEEVYKLAVDQLRNVGIATVAASGNASKCNAIAAPACISSVISVGATDDDDAMAYFSNYQGSLLDLFAPGHPVTSSVASSDSAYQSWSGTSMATPHVAGAFALLRQKDSVSSVGYLLDTLVETGDPATGSADCGTDGEVLPIVRVQVDEAIGRLALVPAAPVELAATADGLDLILLTWLDNASDESGFTIERSVGDDASFSQIAALGADTTTYTDTALSDGTTYFYRIRAYNAHGHSDYSAQADATASLAVPDNLAATAGGWNWILLTWKDNTANESDYTVERSAGDNAAFSPVASLGANATSYMDPALSEGTTYFYRVRASNNGASSAYSAEEETMTPLATPEDLSATAVSPTRIDLVWTDHSAAETGFEIERSTNDLGNFSLIVTVAADVEGYSDTNGLNAASTYYYRIRSTNPSITSSYSDDARATTPASSSVGGSENSGGASSGGGGGCFISLIASD